MTKSFLIAACVLCGASWAAQAQDSRPHPVPVEAGHGVYPLTAGHAVEQVEARSVTPLRESLRQPWSGTDDKPYRLSSEERQRMREQLRAQSSVLESPTK